jgi:hypothetical protein
MGMLYFDDNAKSIAFASGLKIGALSGNLILDVKV